MEPDGDSPPFWSTSTATILHHQRRRRRSPSSIFSPVSLIILLPILALLIIFFLVPPFLSHATQIFRPTYSVRKSWDSLNILLVVFAILCGVFARRNDDVSASETSSDEVGVVSSSDGSFNETSSQHTETSLVTRWFDAPDASANRLRSSSSYPDLRQGLLWEAEETRYRFLDDFDVNLYKQPANSDPLNHRSRRSDAARGENGIKVIPVDTFEVHSARPPSPEPPPKPQAAPPPPSTLKPRQPLHSVPRRRGEEKQRSGAEVAKAELEESQSPRPVNSMQRQRQSHQRRRKVEKVRFQSEVSKAGFEEIRSPPPPEAPLIRPPPPPPPPPLPPLVETEQLSERSLRKKKSGTAKEFATAIASLYADSKRKKKLKQSNSSGSSSEGSPTTLHSSIPPSTPPPPPPPPPPLPSKVFQNLFKKSSKNKRVHSVSATVPPPPPPPPPPPNSIFNNIFKTGSKSKRFNESSSAPPPPPPPPPLPSSILNSIFKPGSKSRRFKLESPTPPPAPPPPPKHQASSKRKSKYTQSQPPPPSEPPRQLRSATWKPPLPAKPNSYYEEYLNSGSQSPLVPLPPPPPPPFKMPELKFVARGDFVRIVSAHSSTCSSPDRADLEDVDAMSAKSSAEAGEGQDSIGPSLFYPSPDVNLKADSFIARLKDEWRLDKMNSMKGRNTLTHGPGPIAD